jgi:response regulator RpfG family c-di-GMP phosphodiesterase
MEPPCHTVLCVDDEPYVLNSLKRLLHKENYRVLTADSGKDALDLLKRNTVHLVVSDQRMPGMSGTELLLRIKSLYPDIIRIMLTGYTDVDAITESINKGHIYKFFLKPWNDHNLKLEIRQALEQYELVEVNKRLDETIFQQNLKLKEIKKHLEAMVKERTMEIALRQQALEISHAVLKNLPIPIIGVDRENVIVMTNRKARNLFCLQKVGVGASLENLLPEMIAQKANDVMSNGDGFKFEAISINAQLCEVQISPLSGRFSGHGVIISVFPIKG